GTVCVVGKMRDLILQLSKSSIYSTKPLVFTILTLIQLYINARYIRASFIEYQMVYAPLLIGMGYVYFNVWRART
ncbi:hypothetical protein ACQF48_28695, partial [Klebsiella pneumoniae]